MMGKGKSKRNGFVVASDKGAGERECCDIDIGLGLVMETHQSFPCKKMNQMHHHHQEAQFCSYGGFHGETASNSEPVFYNTSNNNNCPVTANIYNAVCSDFGSGVPKNLQQSNHSTDSLSFSSSGGMVNVNVRIPFTPAQREELETQTLIYKYIMAFLPVPQQLLLSITKNLPNGLKGSLRTKGLRDVLGLGVSRNLDPEPWRCKRTDGKKWRCSRDIANDQKYCERHCHKRRSRKPVESNPNFIINNINMPSPQPSFCKNNNHQTPFSSTMVTPAAAVTSHGQSRTMDWFMNGESASVAGSNREWEQLMPFKLGLESHHTKRDKDLDFAKQQNENSFNLCRGDSHDLQRQRQISHDHLGGALNSYQAQETRHFIDAWSTERAGIDDIGKSCSVPLNQKLPFSSLTLSVSGEKETSEESVYAQKGLEVLASERENAGDMKSQWMNSLSWMSSTPPGGPLGEALCLRMASST